MHISAASPRGQRLQLLFDQPNGNRIAIELSFACLNRSDNDEDCVQHPKGDQNRNADKHDAENCGNFPWASTSGESPRFTSQTMRGPRRCPRKWKNNPSKAAAWQSTHQVRISEEVAGAGGGGGIGCWSINLSFQAKRGASVRLAAGKRKSGLAPLLAFHTFDVRAEFAQFFIKVFVTTIYMIDAAYFGNSVRL